jgi:hypothetical protein
VLDTDLRCDDQEQAVLLACSSLISVVGDKNHFRVVQFSHFSIKEYLTSDHLAKSNGLASHYHVRPEPAHVVMAQACLSVLLKSDLRASGSMGRSPLAQYAAMHFGDHVEFENVLSCVQDGLDILLDEVKPHLAAWLRVHNEALCSRAGPVLSVRWRRFGPELPVTAHSYYIARFGCRGLVQHLISKRPQDVNARGDYGTPLHAALAEGHLEVSHLLLANGAEVDIWGADHHTHCIWRRCRDTATLGRSCSTAVQR